MLSLKGRVMGYLFLGCAMLCGLTKGFCGKKVSGFVKESRDAMLANFLRMTICIAIGFFVVVFSDGFGGFNVGSLGFLISVLSGVSNAAFVVLWLFAVKRGAYMLVDIFLTLGLVVPILLSAIFFDERIEWNHYVGFAVLLAAVLVMCSYNNTVKAKLDLKSLILLSFCGLAQGLLSFSQKWFAKYSGGSGVSSFNFYTYVFAAAILLGCFLMIKAKDEHSKEECEHNFTIKPIWYFILIMAVMLFLNSYFMTFAAIHLESVVLYPLSTGLGLVLSAAMSSIFFGEKLKARCVVGMVLAFASLIIINLL